MNWVDIIVIIIFIIAFISGMKDGAIKSLSSLVSLFISIPLTGLSYRLIATILSFLPGTNWENFFGFFITMGIISIILHVILLLPRKIIQKIWKKGCLFRLVGGFLNAFGTSIGFAVFTLILIAYPIISWLESVIVNSGILMSLVGKYGFIQAMLPDLLRHASPVVATLTGA